jgi:hypothetical protein
MTWGGVVDGCHPIGDGPPLPRRTPLIPYQE